MTNPTPTLPWPHIGEVGSGQRPMTATQLAWLLEHNMSREEYNQRAVGFPGYAPPTKLPLPEDLAGPPVWSFDQTVAAIQVIIWDYFEENQLPDSECAVLAELIAQRLERGP